MENKILEGTDVPDFVAKIVEKVVSESKVLKETNNNPISLGSDGSMSVKNIYWQPHHLRLYFKFDKTFFNKEKPTLEFGGHSINSTEFEVPDYMEHRIVIKTNQIELTNKVDHKKWYVIRLDDSTRKQQFDICVKKVLESTDVLRSFIKDFGGISDFRLLNFRAQDKLQGEEVIDRLPLKLAFNGELSQKVYNEKNIEFNEPLAVINYVENAALRTVTPIIHEKLNKLDENMVKISEETKNMAYNASSHIALVREATNAIIELKDAVKELKGEVRNINQGIKILGSTRIKEQWGW